MVSVARGLVTNSDFDRLSSFVSSSAARDSSAPLVQALREHLGRQSVGPSQRVPRTLVTMRSQVRLYDVDQREHECFTLVYPEEADINEGKVSVLAPLGRELLGRRAGQTITVNTPVGPKRFKIEKVLFQPEASGRFDL